MMFYEIKSFKISGETSFPTVAEVSWIIYSFNHQACDCTLNYTSLNLGTLLGRLVIIISTFKWGA